MVLPFSETGRTFPRVIRLLANPAAGRGRGFRALPAARAAFAAVGVEDVRLTAGPGDEARLVREALDDGCTTLAVLGGDGTWSKAAAALASAGAGACRLAPLAAGSGNDFVKSAGLPARDYARMAALAVGAGARRIDLGRLRSGGQERLFLNVAGFGFDAAVLAYMERVTWLGGDALYLYAALRQLFGFRGAEARVRMAGADAGWATRLLIAVGNGRHFGGSFAICPDARLDDGLLDVVLVGDMGAARRLAVFGAATRGRHVEAPEATAWRAPAVTLEFRAPPLYDADGELHRAPGAEVALDVVPGALTLVA